VSLAYVTITGTFKDGTGAGLAGSVIFTPSQTVYAAGVPVVTADVPITVAITSGSLGSVQLLATDNDNITAEGLTGFFCWSVAITAGGVSQGWLFFLPSTPTTVDLFALAGTGAGAVSMQNPMTTLGDIIYEDATPTAVRLAGSTSATKKFLTQTGTGSASAVPAWAGIILGDLPAGVALLAGATFTGYVAPAVFALTDGTNIALDASKGNSFTVTIAGNRTLSNPANPVDGQTIRVRVTQDSSGSRTLAYGNAYDFGTVGSPTLTTTANKVDILGFEYVASLSKWCYLGSGLGF
jgi:hypothetical protein